MENNNTENTVIDKLNQIFEIICDVAKEDQAVGDILKEFYTLSLRTLSEIAENGGDTSEVDVSEHINIISNILGMNVRAMMEEVFKDMTEQQVESNKEADATTLEFITSDLDDYEKFIAQNKAKESLDFLSKEI